MSDDPDDNSWTEVKKKKGKGKSGNPGEAASNQSRGSGGSQGVVQNQRDARNYSGQRFEQPRGQPTRTASFSGGNHPRVEIQNRSGKSSQNTSAPPSVPQTPRARLSGNSSSAASSGQNTPTAGGAQNRQAWQGRQPQTQNTQARQPQVTGGNTSGETSVQTHTHTGNSEETPPTISVPVAASSSGTKDTSGPPFIFGSHLPGEPPVELFNPSNVARTRNDEPSTSGENVNNKLDDESHNEGNSWTDFVKIICQNVFRVSRDNDSSYNEQFRLISNGLKIYQTYSRGREAIFPARPGTNIRDRSFVTCEVSANHFEMKIPCVSEISQHAGTSANPQIQFHMYSVTWSKASSQVLKLLKDCKLKWWDEMRKRHGSNPNGMNHVRPIYDGGTLMVSDAPFAWSEAEIKNGVTLENKDISVVITFTGILDWESCREYLTNNNERNIFPKESIRVLNMVMKEYCLRKGYFESGRFYFDKARRHDLDGLLLDYNSGYFQSVRALEGGMTLNVDVMTTAFYKPGKTLRAAWAIMRQNYLPEAKKRSFTTWTENSDWDLEQVGIANEYWKNLRIVSSHRTQLRNDDSNPKAFTIYQLQESSGYETTVEGLYGLDFRGDLCEFMRTKYRQNDQDLWGHMPAIKLSKKLEHYLPWGCCQTTPESRYAGKIENVASLRALERDPKARCTDLLSWMVRRYGPGEPELTDAERSFRIIVEPQMMKIDALQLPKPTMQARGTQQLVWFGDDPNNNKPNPNFNFKTQQVRAAGTVCPWAVLSFDRTGEGWQMLFLQVLREKASALGIGWQQRDPAHVQFSNIRPRNSNEERQKQAKNDVAAIIDRVPQLKLIICFMARKMTPEYATLKAECDIVHGVPLQVVIITRQYQMSDAMFRSRVSMLASNLLLKINVKCGGVNFQVQREAPGNIGSFSAISLVREDNPNNRTILLGADVTHPRGMCSIAAVVATTDSGFLNYASRIHSQPPGVEIIQNLKAMVKDLLSVYYQRERTWPRRIMFFRDGVSETKFLDVLRFEGVEILEAAQEAAQDVAHYLPQLTIILAVKRHHTRFFKNVNSNNVDPVWINISQGTVIDTGVTHPRDYDFFLCSQAALKGTSRATHYYVLLDQINLERRDLYTLIYYLCHTYQRCTRSVSLVTPVYYSHLAAFRAKLYMENFVLESKAMRQRRDYRACELNAHRDLRNRLWFI